MGLFDFNHDGETSFGEEIFGLTMIASIISALEDEPRPAKKDRYTHPLAADRFCRKLPSWLCRRDRKSAGRPLRRGKKLDNCGQCDKL